VGSRHFFLCLLLFAGSGCAALIYEIVWFQLLQLVIGASAVSLGLLLASYMGGLSLGSALFARFIPPGTSPFRIYAYIELGIAAFGILALFGVPLIGNLYIATGFTGILLRGLIAAVCLLPPTILMGASLPALARWVQSGPRLGSLYSANIAGAVFGCLLAGFYLLRVFDMAIATYVAAAINLLVALLAFWLARLQLTEAAATEPIAEPTTHTPAATLIYLSIAISGLTALGAEVIWTRLLSLLLGATVYTFSIILAVFLVGLWLGSSVGSSLTRRLDDTRWALAACQALLTLAIVWTAYSLAIVLPHWPVDPWLATNPWFAFDMDVTRTLRAILPATFLWGASFPLALSAVASKDQDPARFTGFVYAANTAGSIVGALLFSFVLLPAIGSQNSQKLLSALAAASAALAIWAAPRNRITPFVSIAAVVAAAWLAASAVPALPWQVVAYGRRFAPILKGLDRFGGQQPESPLFLGEGLNSSVVITQRGDQRFFYVSGKSEASSVPVDMRLQRMMGHLPALFHPNPRSVLVVGFGAGVTAGSFVAYPEVTNLTVCELENLIPPATGLHFARENNDVIHDRRLHMVYDDARHYIAAARDKFDVITTDPIHPWVKGTSTLYSREYYELVKARLNPGGVVAQWLPIYDSDEATVRTELATFFSVFPHGTVWSNNLNGDDGYDLVLIGRQNDSPLNIDQLETRLRAPASTRIAASLAETGFNSAMDLLGAYAGRAVDLQPLVAGVPINGDLNLRLQYIAGLGLNSSTAQSAQIYRQLISYRKFPADLFTGSAEPLAALRARLEKPQRTF
jgi:spermidine synthase